MKVYSNPVGSGNLWFDNLTTAEGVPVAYDPQARAFLPMPPFCVNREIIGCNWIAPEQGAFCRSCAMTALAPDPNIPDAIPNWAETAAHLLHLSDITDSFVASGLTSPEWPQPGWDPYSEPDTALLIHVAASLAIRVNHVNRSMGLSDLYPFVLSEMAQRKLAFVHDWLRRGAQGR